MLLTHAKNSIGGINQSGRMGSEFTGVGRCGVELTLVLIVVVCRLCFCLVMRLRGYMTKTSNHLQRNFHLQLNSGKATRKRNKLLYSVTFSALLKRGGHEMIKSFQCLQGQENILSIGKPNIQGLSSGTQKFQSDHMHSGTLYWRDKCHKK